MKKIIFVITILGLGLNQSFGQFQTGMPTSNLAGVMGITVNPANTNYLNNGTDFLLFSASMSILNNGFYLDRKPIPALFSPSNISAFTGKSATGEKENINETFDRVFNLRRSLKDNNYIFADAVIYGPSMLINHKKHSFGFTTAFKTNSGTVRLAPEMAIFMLKGPSAIELQEKSFNWNNVISGTLVYTDIALNYSYEILDTYKSKHRIGISAHYLNGINSIDIADNGNSKWSFIGDSSIAMENGNFRYNYAATKSGKMSELLASRGKGFAFDLGYTYVRKSKARPTIITVCPNISFGGSVREYQSYKWKFGVSLMDVGFIDFNHQTIASTFADASGISKNLDQEFYKGVFALDRRLQFDFSGIGQAKYTRETAYRHYTATRFQFQFDYNYKNNIFFNFSGSQRLPMPGAISMVAPNILSLTTRFEKMQYEWGVPISLIEYQHPIMGLYFRYGPFYLGTNHLLETVGIRNIRGADFFFGLKFNFSNFKGV
ncbi:MAG: DUF5723 family protein [Bacteroidota bacterium]|nr:DUF5723 family protein [Bacteroidota bacterium]